MKASLPDEDKPVAVAGNECILLKEEAGILWSRMFSLPAHQAPIFAMSVQDLDVCKPPKYDWVSPAQRLADDPSKLPDEDFDSSTNTFDIMDKQTWTSIKDKKGKAVKDTLKYVASKPAVLQGMDGIAILPGFVSTDAPDKYTPSFLTDQILSPDGKTLDVECIQVHGKKLAVYKNISLSLDPDQLTILLLI